MRQYKIVQPPGVDAIETHKLVAEGVWGLACDDKTLQPHIWDKHTKTRWPASDEFLAWQHHIYCYHMLYKIDLLRQEWEAAQQQ